MQEIDISLGDIFSGMIPAPLQSIIDFFKETLGLGDEGGQSLGERFGAIIKNLLTPMIDMLNDKVIGTINEILNWDPPGPGGWVSDIIPGMETGYQIPIIELAKGGIVNSPTLALIGEAGPEAVVPLNSQGKGMAGGNQTFNMTFNLSGVTDRTDKRKLAQDVSQMLRTELRRTVGSTSVRGGLS